MDGNRATIFPDIQNVYSSLSCLSMSYRGETKLLKFYMFVLYQIPAFPNSPPHPPITSSFGDIEETWLAASSKFKFSDNYFDFVSVPMGEFIYGVIMFAEFEQGAKNLQDCTSDCNPHNYLLQARYFITQYYSVYSIEDEVIVT